MSSVVSPGASCVPRWTNSAALGFPRKPNSLCSAVRGPHVIPLHSCQNFADRLSTLVPPGQLWAPFMIRWNRVRLGKAVSTESSCWTQTARF